MPAVAKLVGRGGRSSRIDFMKVSLPAHHEAPYKSLRRCGGPECFRKEIASSNNFKISLAGKTVCPENAAE
jgi:hypothetical protein